MHNLTLGNPVEAKAAEETKQEAKEVSEAKPQPAPEIVPAQVETGLEEGEEIIEIEDEDDEYSEPLIRVDKNYAKVGNLNSSEDAIKLIGKRYKRLGKILNSAVKRFGAPSIKFVVSKEQGEKKVINGVERQHRARTHRNEDGSWLITFYQGNPDIIKTLAHEMVHVFTIGAIDKSAGKYSRTLKAIYAACLDTMSKQERQLYGLKNPKEFIAEFFANTEL
jgi:hypothetical protein